MFQPHTCSIFQLQKKNHYKQINLISYDESNLILPTIRSYLIYDYSLLNINKLCQLCILEGLHKNDEGYTEYHFTKIPLGSEELRQAEVITKEKQNLKYLLLIDHLINQKEDMQFCVENIQQQLIQVNQVQLNQQQNSNQSAFDMLFQKEQPINQNLHQIKLKELNININEVFNKIETKIDDLYLYRQQNQQRISNLKQSLYNHKTIRQFGQEQLLNLLQESEKNFQTTMNQGKGYNKQSIFDSLIFNDSKSQNKVKIQYKKANLDQYNFDIIKVQSKQKKSSGKLRRLTCCAFKSFLCLFISWVIFGILILSALFNYIYDNMDYQGQIQLKFEKGDTLNYNSQVLYDEGSFQESIDQLQKSIIKNKGSFKVYNNLANAYYQLENFDESEKYYKKALIEMKNDIIYYNYANLLIHLGRKNEAIKLYQKAIELYSQFHEAYYNLGILYATKQEFQQSLKMIQKAVQIEPKEHKYKFSAYLIEQISQFDEEL
ncbi:hypothetical protein pb186bvf_002683 [Paramecium bursaria]